MVLLGESLTRDMTERGDVGVSRRQIDVEKASPRPHEYFSVTGLSMTLLGKPQFVAEGRIRAN